MCAISNVSSLVDDIGGEDSTYLYFYYVYSIKYLMAKPHLKDTKFPSSSYLWLLFFD